LIAGPEILIDGFRLCGAFDDDDVHRKWRFAFLRILLGPEGIVRLGRPVLQVHADGAMLFKSASPNPGLLAASMLGFRHKLLLYRWFILEKRPQSPLIKPETCRVSKILCAPSPDYRLLGAGLASLSIARQEARNQA